jgi:hypothetical protein
LLDCHLRTTEEVPAFFEYYRSVTGCGLPTKAILPTELYDGIALLPEVVMGLTLAFILLPYYFI